MEEREIDLRLLIFKTLKFWRRALILGLVLALLLGGYSLFSQSKADQRAAEEAHAKLVEEYETNVGMLQNEYDNLKRSSEAKKEYLAKSALMTINPYNEYVAFLHVEVDGDHGAKAVDKLASFISCGEMYEAILEKTDVADEVRYLNELINTEVNYDAETISISAVGASENSASTLAALIKDAVDEEAKTLAGCRCSSRCEKAYSMVDDELEEKQTELVESIASAEASMLEINKELKEIVEPAPFTSGVSLTAAAKKGIIGFVVGAIAVFGWYCVKFVITSKLSGDDFWKAVKVSFLGSVFTEKGRKENAIDKFIRSLCGYSEDLSFDASCSLVSANIAALQKNLGEKKLALVGSMDKETAQKLLAGTGVDFAGDILSESSAVKSLEQYDGVIISATEGVTGMDQICHQLGLIKSWGKEVAGAVSVK